MYGLSNSSMRTSKGVQLNQADQQTLIRGLYGKAAASGKTAGFGEELWKTLSESEDSTIKGYKDIQEEIDEITEGMDEATIATDSYVQALEAAKQAAMEAAPEPRPGPTGIPCSLAYRIKSQTMRQQFTQPIRLITPISYSRRSIYS